MPETLLSLCLNHLRHEEAMLRSTLDIAEGIQDALGENDASRLTKALRRQRDLVRMNDELQRRRRKFSEDAGRLLGQPARTVRLSDVLNRLSGRGEPAASIPSAPARIALAEAICRVRRRAQDLATVNFAASIHVRIHLDAYRSILRELTRTQLGSGRYGPAGRAETPDYRPLLQLHG